MFIAGDDELAAAPVGHAMLDAIFVQQGFAFDAGERLERALRVVDAGVDDFGIARAGMRAYGVLAFEDHHLATGEGERARDREADHPGADDDRVKLFHAAALAARGFAS